MSDSNNFLNIIIKKIVDNKLLIFILILSIYSSKYVYYLPDNYINFFDNTIVKFVIFGIISFISMNNPGIGIILTIAILVTFQVISNIKIKKEIDLELNIEKFALDNVNGFTPNDQDYYYNPILKLDQLDPVTSNLDLNFETPNQLYNNMIISGRELLDYSNQMNSDLEKRWDIREKNISDMTQKEGLVQVQSGINRLQSADLGEYNMPIYSDKNVKKYIQFDSNSYDKYLIYSKNNEIMESFNKMIIYYDKLQTNILNPEEFNELLINFYEAKLNLLETIFKYKKNSMNNEQIDKVNINIKDAKEETNLNKTQKKNNHCCKKIIGHLEILSEILL